MKTLANIARYHLADRLTYLALPWAILAFSFLINVVISARLPSPQGDYTGGLFTIYGYLLVCGALSMTRALPFGLMLGNSRRGYYLGTALLIVVLGAVCVTVSAMHNWAAVGHFFAAITAPALIGVLAALTVVLGLGGLATIRRVTI